MGALLGLYILLWGLGLMLDPRLAEHTIIGIIGMGLLMGGWALMELRITFPLEFIEKWINSRFSLKLIIVFCVLISIAATFYYYFNPESQ